MTCFSFFVSTNNSSSSSSFFIFLINPPASWILHLWNKKDTCTKGIGPVRYFFRLSNTIFNSSDPFNAINVSAVTASIDSLTQEISLCHSPFGKNTPFVNNLISVFGNRNFIRATKSLKFLSPYLYTVGSPPPISSTTPGVNRVNSSSASYG